MQWSDIPRSPSRKTLTQFALLCAAVLVWQGLTQWLRRDRPELGIVLIVLAVSLANLGLVRPLILRPVFVGWMILVFPLGWLVSNVVLAVIYFLLFLPFGLFFRIKGRDVLNRKQRRDLTTYWQPRPTTPDPGRYFRPY